MGMRRNLAALAAAVALVGGVAPTALADAAMPTAGNQQAAAVVAVQASHSRVFRSTSPGGRAYTSGRVFWKENSTGQVYDGKIQGTVWDKAGDQRCAYAKIKVTFSSGGGGIYTSDHACKPGHKINYSAGPDRRINWIGVKACTTDGKCDPHWR